MIIIHKKRKWKLVTFIACLELLKLFQWRLLIGNERFHRWISKDKIEMGRKIICIWIILNIPLFRGFCYLSSKSFKQRNFIFYIFFSPRGIFYSEFYEIQRNVTNKTTVFFNLIRVKQRYLLYQFLLLNTCQRSIYTIYFNCESILFRTPCI